MSWAELSVASRVERKSSSVESCRFGLEIERMVVGADAIAEEVTAAICESTSEVLIVRSPAQRVDLGAALVTKKRIALHVDTLVYHRFKPAQSDDRGCYVDRSGCVLV